jgi:hypothetical protein
MTGAADHWETARLVARRAMRDAAPHIFESCAQDPDVARYMIWRPHRDVEETVAFLDRCERAWQDGTATSRAMLSATRSSGESKSRGERRPTNGHRTLNTEH